MQTLDQSASAEKATGVSGVADMVEQVVERESNRKISHHIQPFINEYMLPQFTVSQIPKNR